MKNSTYDSLVAEHGGNPVRLYKVIEYAGFDTEKAAIEAFNKGTFAFPTFPLGGKNRKWWVDLKKLAQYIDKQEREYTEKFNYLHN